MEKQTLNRFDITDHGTTEFRTLGQQIWFRFRKSKLAMIGSAALLVLYAMAIFAPWLAPYDYADIAMQNRFIAPSSEYLLGTDHLGRCVWSRVVWGARVSLAVGFVAAFFSVTIGTVIGSVAGYYGGRIDNVLMRMTEIVSCFPTMLFLLTIMAILPRNIFTIMVVIGLTSWPTLSRIVRAEVLAIRESEYVQASRASGATDARIVFRHVLPNVMAPIIVNATLRIATSILSETSLSFLGLGAPPPYPTWGAILADGRGFLRNAPWISTIPGVFIFIAILAFNFVGDGLRDALDPKLKQ